MKILKKKYKKSINFYTIQIIHKILPNQYFIPKSIFLKALHVKPFFNFSAMQTLYNTP